MAFEISTYLTHSVYVPACSFDMTVGATTESLAWPAGYYIALFHAADSSGGVSDPWIAWAKLEDLAAAALGIGLDARIRRDGRIELAHAYDEWSLAWGGTAAAALFGFARDIPTTSAGVWVCADYCPAGVIASASRADSGPVPVDRGHWRDAPRPSAGRRPGLDVATKGSRRELQLRFHPRDHAAASAVGTTATPLYPTPGDAFFRTTDNVGAGFFAGDATGLVLPWTILDSVLYAVPPIVWVYALGNFQDFISATGVALSEPVYTTREYPRLGYLDISGMTGLDVRPSFPGSRHLRDVGTLALIQTGFGQDLDWSPHSY